MEGTPPPLFAGFEADGHALEGPAGDRLTSVSGALRLPWKRPEEFDTPVYLFRAAQTRRTRDGAPGTHRTDQLQLGVEYFQQLSLGLSFWTTPSISQTTGAYRAHGWSASFFAWGPGFFPRLNIEAPLTRGPLESRFGVVWSGSTFEERLEASTSTLRWFLIKERSLGFRATETWRGRTSLNLLADFTSYDKKVDNQIRQGQLLLLSQTDAAVSPERRHGFVSFSWGAGFEQAVTRWIQVTGRWQRFFYENGATHRADDYRGRLALRVPRAFTFYTDYVVFKPERKAKSEYKGAGLQFPFGPL
ncbi:MAG: hypothetical protein HY548_07205 [Elusimicrobia bacterium]|nr:hypothetical protein [Elusimicrobiota bacterium]